MLRSLARVVCAGAVVLLGWQSGCMAAAQEEAGVVAIGVTRELVQPSRANPDVRSFDDNDVVLVPRGGRADAPLAVFLPGTHGKPENAWRLMNVVAGQGYRVIGLSYNDDPAVNVLCPKRPNPECAARFRAMRVFAQGPAPVENSYAESIEGRLISVLQYLQREHPEAGWGQYLSPEGQVRWPRVVVSGLSQGAGMAAFIAKQRPVYRVVLFSSPWDFFGPDHRPSPWLFERSPTPPERWWAERHVRENTTAELAMAYRALRIPEAHIFLFDQGLAGDRAPQGENPYHPSTIQNPAYVPQWREMYGVPGQP